MADLYLALAFFLLLTILGGLLRIQRGPTAADRMLAAQLFGTAGVAILLLLAEAYGRPALRDIGLVYGLLAAVAAVTFARRVWQQAGQEEKP